MRMSALLNKKLGFWCDVALGAALVFVTF